jgi:hypothetical protein
MRARPPYKPGAASRGIAVNKLASVAGVYTTGVQLCTQYTGFTFLSTVKSSKFSRLGHPGVLNLVPLGTKFSTPG